MRGLKSVDCAKHLFPALDAMQLIERGFVAPSCTGLPQPADGAMCVLGTLPMLSLSWDKVCRTAMKGESLRASSPRTDRTPP